MNKKRIDSKPQFPQTYYAEVKEKLENFPTFRERRARSIYLTKLALRKCGLEARHENREFINFDELADFAITFDSYRHAWGEVTRECENLRGNDYDEGEILRQTKALEYTQ